MGDRSVPCSEFIDIGPFRFECSGHPDEDSHIRSAIKYRGGKVAHHALSPGDVGDADVTFWTWATEAHATARTSPYPSDDPDGTGPR